jgi:putative NADPH-quinone reductase
MRGLLMRVLVIFAHPLEDSYGAALRDVVIQSLEGGGHTIDLCDLYREAFDPMIVLPDDTVAHPLQVSIDIASLAPNAEITVFPWKDPADLKARTINRARAFLKRHQTA